MTRKSNLVWAATILIASASGFAEARAQGPNPGRGNGDGPDPEPARVVVAGTNRFALDLYARLRSGPGNLFFSPYSISSALAMSSSGAAGQTDREIAAALHVPADQAPRHAGFKALIGLVNGGQPGGPRIEKEAPARPDPRPGTGTEARPVAEGGAATAEDHKSKAPHQGETPAKGDQPAAPAADASPKGDRLASANALWLQQGMPFLPAFLEASRDSYGASPFGVDFAADPEMARLKINGWVQDRTAGKIRDLVPSTAVDRSTSLVLTNAIYFKGSWLRPFLAEATVKDVPFRSPGDKAVKVPMMTQTESYRHLDGGTFQVLEIPYAENGRSMLVVLPKAVDGLAALEAGLTPEALQGWLDGLERGRVHLQFPRFAMEESFQLSDVLGALGMPSAFDPLRADFSGMTGRRDLWLSAVIHRAAVDVTEEGTEAAAGTAILIPRSTTESPIVEFKVDHPFIMLIRDRESGAILFLGRVNEPKAP